MAIPNLLDGVLIDGGANLNDIGVNNLSGASPGAASATSSPAMNTTAFAYPAVVAVGNRVAAGNNIGTGEGGMPLGNYRGGFALRTVPATTLIGGKSFDGRGRCPHGQYDRMERRFTGWRAKRKAFRGSRGFQPGGAGEFYPRQINCPQRRTWDQPRRQRCYPPNSNVGITGPNNLQNFPIITNSIVEHAGTCTFTVVWGSLSAHQQLLYRRYLLGSDSRPPRIRSWAELPVYWSRREPMAKGIATFWAQIPEAVTTDLSATATDATGDTSEFGRAFSVTLQQVQFNGTGNREN